MKKMLQYSTQLPPSSRWSIMRFWDPLLGCTPCSIGCQRCSSARTQGYRTKEAVKHDGRVWRFDGQVLFKEDAFAQVTKFPPNEQIFVCGRSDIFHEQVPDEYVKRIIEAATTRPDCTFFAITKRPKRFETFRRFPRNFWVSISIENQKMADLRIPYLNNVEATRIISAKPLLGEIDLSPYRGLFEMVIVGGEYGLNARPMYPGWARSLRDWCLNKPLNANAVFSFHNWGLWIPGENRITRHVTPDGRIHQEKQPNSLPMHIHEKQDDGSLLDNQRWDQYPK